MRLSIYTKEENKEHGLELIKAAEEHGFIIDDNNPDVVITAGGDGTFLRAVQKYFDRLDHISFVSINFGTLGFFAQYQKEEIEQLFLDIKNKQYILRHFRLLKGIATYEDEEKEFYAVNEIRVENPFRTLRCEVYINNELLESYRGNGLIVSSSTGSSAYNKSLGGALVDLSIPSMQLTEIAPIKNNLYSTLGSSLVLNGDSELDFKGQFNKSVVGYDSVSIDKENLTSLKVTLSDKKINIIHRHDYSLVRIYRKSFVK